MTDRTSVEIIGDKELLNMMRQLPKRLTNKHVGRATNQGAAMVRDEVRRRAPKRSGRLRRNIMSKSRRGKRHYRKASIIIRTEGAIKGGVVAIGGVSGRKNPKDAFYWVYLEERGAYGHAPRPFIRPAAATKFRPVVSHISKETGKGLKQEVARLTR